MIFLVGFWSGWLNTINEPKINIPSKGLFKEISGFSFLSAIEFS